MQYDSIQTANVNQDCQLLDWIASELQISGACYYLLQRYFSLLTGFLNLLHPQLKITKQQRGGRIKSQFKHSE